MIQLDVTMQAVIAFLFTTASTAIGWLIKALWTERGAAQEKLAAMLEKSYDATTGRKDLWDNLNKVVDGQTREIADLKRVNVELVAEIRNRRPV